MYCFIFRSGLAQTFLTDTNTAPGLIEPGMLVEVLDITGDWQGLCLATSISASGVGAVIQSVDLERHY